MENTLIDGRYLLLSALGSGGEARVYHARDESTGADVALKLGLSPATRTESLVLPQFHPGWVQFLNTGTDAQFGAYQIFELLEGQTLGQLVPQNPFDAEDWRVFVDQSLDAVEALHVAGWVHGDINANNFFATNVCWKLLELPFFHLDPPQGRSALFGSIFTLAPEQINGAKPNIGSDLYALGCLYYYAACGAYPHTGATGAEIAIGRLRFEPDPLNQKPTALPVPWSDWVMKLLARQPDDRFPSVAAARQLLGVA
jgi:serine/threonine protein kinase